MMPTLVMEDVATNLGDRSFRYGLRLEGAQIVAVTGPSGAGKSTLLNLIAGFETPLSGAIILNGSDVGPMPPGKRPVSYIFQDHNLFAHLDVEANVALGLKTSLSLTSRDRTIVGDALAKVGLPGFQTRKPQALSGGERQRVAFARALVRKRPFLLLDEPFASLDEVLRQEMGGMVRQLQVENNMMVLMISHDRNEVAGLADRVVEIVNGRVAFCGAPDIWMAAKSPV